LNDTKFFLNFPISLAAGQSVTAQILDVTVGTGAAFGLHVGSMSILGGATSNDQTTQATQTFAVNVVPEPGTFVLIITAIFIGYGIIASGRSKWRRIPAVWQRQ
jgi:hypothetical protein